MKDIDTCQHGLKPQCPEITNPIVVDFLALVKKLVDVNNSTISVVSKENEGSCFEIVIPNIFIKTQEK